MLILVNASQKLLVLQFFQAFLHGVLHLQLHVVTLVLIDFLEIQVLVGDGDFHVDLKQVFEFPVLEVFNFVHDFVQLFDV